MTSINVQVEQDDIERAVKSNSSKCVVAQALARTIRDANRFDVDVQTIRFTRYGKRYVYLTPRSIQEYIIAFDAGDEIQPFGFRLMSPQITETKRKSSQDRGHIAPAGKSGRTPTSRVGGRTPPKSGWSHTREYGTRVMRVNQTPVR